MKYIVDIDGTICTVTNGDYINAELLSLVRDAEKPSDDTDSAG